jgi:antibiotic biosynthesis monooxygenase (ABM) superfamily enzyme
MTVYFCRNYIVKPDKLKEHNKWGKKLVALMKKKPGLFSDARSIQVLRQCGSKFNFFAIWGYTGKLDFEGWEAGFCEIPNEDALREEFMELIEPSSNRAQIHKPIKTLRRNIRIKHKKSNQKKPVKLDKIL